jgi:hypothetical protein
MTAHRYKPIDDSSRIVLPYRTHRYKWYPSAPVGASDIPQLLRVQEISLSSCGYKWYPSAPAGASDIPQLLRVQVISLSSCGCKWYPSAPAFKSFSQRRLFTGDSPTLHCNSYRHIQGATANKANAPHPKIIFSHFPGTCNCERSNQFGELTWYTGTCLELQCSNTLKRHRRRLKDNNGHSTPHYSAFTNDKSVLTQNDLFQRRHLSNAILTKYSTTDYLQIQCEIIRKSIQHDINEVLRLKNIQIQHPITKLY